MAVDYLKRQRRKFNVRRVSSAIHPYEPYIHAAKTLRASGYMLSADKVELERLRMRRAALSWRTAGPLRLLLKLTDLSMNYGFAPIRLIGLTILLIAAGSFLTTAGKQAKIVEDVFQRTELAATNTDADYSEENRLRSHRGQGGSNRAGLSGSGTPSTPIERENGKNDAEEEREERMQRDLESNIETEESVLAARPQMIPVVYVLDVVVPFLDLGQENQFRFMRPAELNTAMKMDWVEMYWIVPVLLKLFGWILTSLIAISIAARLETIMARNEEA